MSKFHSTIKLEPIAVDPGDLDFLRDLAKEYGVEYFNLRLAKGRITSFSILKKISKSSNTGIGKGFSILAFTKGGYGFAIGTEFTKVSIQKTFVEAAKLARWSSKFVKKPFSLAETPGNSDTYSISQKLLLSEVEPQVKLQNLLDVEKEAYENPLIVSSNLNYSDHEEERIIYNNYGRFLRLNTSGLYFVMQAIAKNESRQEGYHVTFGSNGGFEKFDQARGLGYKVAANAVELLGSKPAPQGVHNLIMDPLLTGTFTHEAFGHAAEADSIVAEESILADKLNTKIGSDLISIIDDGTLKNNYGYIPFDDEGIPSQRTTIVKDGILVGYLHDLESAGKLGFAPTGNGRTAGYSVTPQARMTNTFVEPGNATIDEMCQEMKNGILGIGWKYGYCDPISGSFQFKLAKAFRIENGEKTQVLRDTAISGMTLNVMNRIRMISKEFKQDSGYCGKGGQSVPVGSGGPYTLIEDMVIGGE
ncbi:MAG: TldD/PmbA family protein [Promethearchaeota archaeon]